jgi:hypothetical protein
MQQQETNGTQRIKDASHTNPQSPGGWFLALHYAAASVALCDAVDGCANRHAPPCFAAKKGLVNPPTADSLGLAPELQVHHLD